MLVDLFIFSRARWRRESGFMDANSHTNKLIDGTRSRFEVLATVSSTGGGSDTPFRAYVSVRTFHACDSRQEYLPPRWLRQRLLLCGGNGYAFANFCKT